MFPLFPLLFLTSLFLFNFLARISFGPLMPVLEQNLGLSHGAAGSLFLFISGGYTVGLLLSGFFSSHLGHRKTISLASLAVGASLFFISMSSSKLTLIIGLVCLGVSAGPYIPSGVATINKIAPPQSWGKAYAIHELAPNLSFVVAPLIVETLLYFAPWRSVPLFLGSSATILGLLFLRYGKGGDFKGEPLQLKNIKRLIKIPSFWIMMFIFSMGVGASLGVYAMIPLYLVAERGMDRLTVNEFLAFSRISGLFMAFLGGWISDRMGPRATIVGGFLLTGAVTILLGILRGDYTLIAVFLQPAVSVCFFPAAFSAISRIGPPETSNITISLIAPVSFFVGGGAIPALIGISGEELSFSVGIILVGCLLWASLIAVKYLRLEVKKEQAAEAVEA